MIGTRDLQRRSLPPFAHDIDPKDDLVLVYCGRRCWQLAEPGEDRVASLAFPRGRSPSAYRWPVHSRTVLVLAGDEKRETVDLLLVELLRAGARVVHAKYSDSEQLVTYDPSERRRKAGA